MARFDRTDLEWSAIQPLLPAKVRGVPRADDRKVLSGIFWRLRTGAP
jgi:transposase